MVQATWRGHVLATSDETVVVEGNHYFPAASVDRGLLAHSDHHTTCPWKGEASYYHVVTPDGRNDDAAWYYPKPKDEARQIAGYIAFWKGVEIR